MIIKDEEQLRQPSELVKPEEVDELIAKLEEELRKSATRGRPGIGLAAAQVGIFKKIAIIRIKTSTGAEYNLDLVNPEIIEAHDPIVFDEGCLSFPGKSVRTNRFAEILVKSEADPKEFVATGLIAVCVQHEIDHLNGILMMDRAADLS